MTNELKPIAMSEAELTSLAEFIIHEAKKRGADQAEVNLSLNKGFSVAGHKGGVETVEYHQDKGVDIDVFFGKKSGSASLTDLRPEAIRAAVEAACHIAKFTGEDEASGLAEKEELAFNYPSVDIHFPWPITVEQAIEKVLQCEATALKQDTRIISAEEVSLATMEALHVYANSHGFCGIFPFSRHQMSCVLVAKKGDEMQREYSYTVATDPELLHSPDVLAVEAADRTVKRLGGISLPTLKVPVIFVAEEARGLIGHFISAMQGGKIYRQSSFLVDHLHKKVFPSFMKISEQPLLSRGLGSAPFDSDGVATRDNIFIEEGMLQQYALSVYTARKLGLKTTGNAGGCHNVMVQHGHHDLPALIKKMHKGLLITELMGQGVNVLTGDYSRGAGGFWVENGEIQYPVHEVTVAGHLQEIYSNIVEVGSDVDIRGNVRTGSILVEEMMIAGS